MSRREGVSAGELARRAIEAYAYGKDIVLLGERVDALIAEHKQTSF